MLWQWPISRYGHFWGVHVEGFYSNLILLSHTSSRVSEECTSYPDWTEKSHHYTIIIYCITYTIINTKLLCSVVIYLPGNYCSCIDFILKWCYICVYLLMFSHINENIMNKVYTWKFVYIYWYNHLSFHTNLLCRVGLICLNGTSFRWG